MSEPIFYLSYTAAFVLALLPLVWGELRHNRIPNAGNILLLVVGCLSNGDGLWLGIFEFSQTEAVFDGLCAFALLGAFAMGIINGGSIKFLIALLPWLDIGGFLILLTFGMALLAAYMGLFKRESAVLTPVFAVLTVWWVSYPVWSA